MDIHVIYGGMSTEHEISLRSAKEIINNLDKTKYNVSYTYITKEGQFVPVGNYDKEIKNTEELKVDSNLSTMESINEFLNFIDKLDNPIVIPCIHGTTGEDGHIQGFLSTLGLRFVGNDVLSSALCFDKAIANDIFAINNIPQAKYYTLKRSKYEGSQEKEKLAANIFDYLGEKVFVKPANNGSSIGVSKANRDNIIEAIEEAFQYDNKVLIEEEMPQVELEVSVIGNDKPLASLPGSYHTEREIFDYEAKYHDTKTIRNVPHELPRFAEDKVRELAIDAYLATSCQGFARVDIFMDEDYNFYVNEINTFPGMTLSSLSPDLWTATDGMSYQQLLDKLIEYAIERYEDEKF